MSPNMSDTLLWSAKKTGQKRIESRCFCVIYRYERVDSLEKCVFQGGNQTFVVTSTGPSRRSEKENKKRRLQKIEKTFFVACRIKLKD